MSILSNLYTGISGMNAFGTGIRTVGDNLANLNTTGFKRSRVNFHDVMSQFVLGSQGFEQVGRGTAVGEIQKLFTQGDFQSTNVSTDVGIQGRGFLVLQGNYEGQSGNFYSRAGQLRLSQEGYLVNSMGLRVQGTNAGPNGTLNAGSGAVSDIDLGARVLPPQATGRVDIAARLIGASGDIPTRDPVADPFLPLDPYNSSDFSHTVTVTDPDGAQHEVNIFFRRNDDEEWSWHATAAAEDVVGSGGVAGTQHLIGEGTLSFQDGWLDIENAPPIPVTFEGSTAQSIEFNFGDARTTDAQGVSGSELNGTVFFTSGELGDTGEQSSILSSSVDGYPPGELRDFSIGNDGVIEGFFSNGQQRTLAQLALADFQVPTGLEKAGATLFTATTESGDAVIGSPGQGGRGTLVAGVLEQSNVEITEEFVNLIALQRSFQASSRTITTADQLLNETLNLKR